MACELIPWDWYKSASSHHASASVGMAPTSSVKADTASESLDIERRRAIRRFMMGCERSQVSYPGLQHW